MTHAENEPKEKGRWKMAGKGQTQKRKDKDRIVLRKGETQRATGTYDYRWTGKDGKRHSIYAKTLEELREK